MSQPITFGKLLGRIIFVILILGMLSAPQLLSDNPDPIFARVRSLLTSVSLPVWFVIIAVFLAVLWVITNLQKATSAQTGDQSPAEAMVIVEAVKSQHGGNGLATVSYTPSLKFMRILGWLAVRDPDKECIVIDGKHVIKSTQLYFAPMLLIGKPVTARRILLSPTPLEDIKATALTSDQLELTLVVSVKYSVSDPAYVASLSAPISELTNLITGVIVELIHGHTLEDIIKDDGTLRQMLKQKLGESITIKNFFKIDEVLKALPTGDERIIEIIRKTREAIQTQALIEQEGENKVRAADFDLAIKKAEARLKEEFDQRQHKREMEMLHMQQEYEAVRELMRTIAQVAASGVNPGPAIKEIRAILSQTKSESTPALPKTVSEQPTNLILTEQRNIECVQEKIGFKSFEIKPYAGKPDQPGSVVVQFNDFTLLIDCTDEYPAIAPQVAIQTSQGSTFNITVPWYVGSNLIDVITAAAMQARIRKNK